MNWKYLPAAEATDGLFKARFPSWWAGSETNVTKVAQTSVARLREAAAAFILAVHRNLNVYIEAWTDKMGQ